MLSYGFPETPSSSSMIYAGLYGLVTLCICLRPFTEYSADGLEYPLLPYIRITTANRLQAAQVVSPPPPPKARQPSLVGLKSRTAAQRCNANVQ